MNKENLELTHLQHYPIGGENALRVKTDRTSIIHTVKGILEDHLLITDFDVPIKIEYCKPLLRPMSDLYKEIDGKVDIVEIAKLLSGTIHVEKIEGACRNLSYFRCTFEDYGMEELIINETCEGWYRSYFDKNQPSTGRNVINQFEVFAYLFSRHYDAFSLIDKGLAIDINTIK